jgi:hypothetical protein
MCELITRQGKTEYVKFKNGEPLSHKEAIKAQCYACYIEQAAPKELDCLNNDCSLYAFQPYNPNPNRKKRILSDDERILLAERMKNINKNKKDDAGLSL